MLNRLRLDHISQTSKTWERRWSNGSTGFPSFQLVVQDADIFPVGAKFQQPSSLLVQSLELLALCPLLDQAS